MTVRGLLARIGTGLARADAGLAGLRDSLTPGQRWTSALALLLAAVVLLYGAPTRTVSPPPQAAGTPGTAADAPREQPTTDAAEPETGQPERTRIARPPATEETPPPGPAPETGDADDQPAAAEPSDDREFELPPPLPEVRALARAGDGPPQRDDEAVAQAFAEQADFALPVETYEFDADEEEHAETCAGLDADVVVASRALPAPLQDCLADRGVRVVAYDERGSDLEQGRFSSRREIGALLVELVEWATDADALAEPVGLAVGVEQQPAVEAVLPELAERGLEPEVHVVADESDVGQGVLDFQSAGVATTVFALPMDFQRRWLAAAQLASPETGYLVLDAADAVLDETYPPGFAGSLAYTPLAAWTERHDQETAEQQDCRERWESGAQVTAGDDELARVLLWCQHVNLVGELVAAVRDGTELARALPEATLTSPLSTPLGPHDEHGWGPGEEVVATWRADCACWTEPTPAGEASGFAPRAVAAPRGRAPATAPGG